MLTDVANIVDGVENNAQAAWMNQTPAIILNVQRQRVSAPMPRPAMLST